VCCGATFCGPDGEAAGLATDSFTERSRVRGASVGSGLGPSGAVTGGQGDNDQAFLRRQVLHDPYEAVVVDGRAEEGVGEVGSVGDEVVEAQTVAERGVQE
jgi:hypothetical protein